MSLLKLNSGFFRRGAHIFPSHNYTGSRLQRIQLLLAQSYNEQYKAVKVSLGGSLGYKECKGHEIHKMFQCPHRL